MNLSEQHQNGHQHSGYGMYILVWLVLLILTGITVAVAGIDFGNFTVATALIIASVKSYFVLSIFMHLKIENKIFSIFVGVALVFLVISLILLFSDYSFLRG